MTASSKPTGVSETAELPVVGADGEIGTEQDAVLELGEEVSLLLDRMPAELGHARRGVDVHVGVGVEQLLHVVEILGHAQVDEQEGRVGVAAYQPLGLPP